MTTGVDIYIYGIVDGLILGIHLIRGAPDLLVGDTFGMYYEIKQHTHEELLSGALPDYTPLNVQSVCLTITSMTFSMGGHTRLLDRLDGSSGRYAAMQMVGAGLEHVKMGCCLRTSNSRTNTVAAQ